MFKDTMAVRLQDRVRRSALMRVIRPTRELFWDCKDFLLDQLARVGPGVDGRVLLAAMPKSGTHVLLGALNQLRELRRWPKAFPNCKPVSMYRESLRGLARNRFAIWHYGANEETLRIARELELSVLVMVRDPRDVILSFVDYVTRLEAHVLHAYYRSLPGDIERISAAIRGVSPEVVSRDAALQEIAANNPTYPGISDIGACCRSFLGWKSYPLAMLVRFEDIIGFRGGGSDQLQFEQMSRIVQFLGLNYSDAAIRTISSRIYNPDSHTFNKGVAGRWKTRFDDRLCRQFRQAASRELIEMGYEKDENW